MQLSERCAFFMVVDIAKWNEVLNAAHRGVDTFAVRLVLTFLQLTKMEITDKTIPIWFLASLVSGLRYKGWEKDMKADTYNADYERLYVQVLYAQIVPNSNSMMPLLPLTDPTPTGRTMQAMRMDFHQAQFPEPNKRPYVPPDVPNPSPYVPGPAPYVPDSDPSKNPDPSPTPIPPDSTPTGGGTDPFDPNHPERTDGGKKGDDPANKNNNNNSVTIITLIGIACVLLLFIVSVRR